MTQGVIRLFCLLLVLFALPLQARNVPENLADVVETLTPAVVNISTTKEVAAPRSPFSQFEDALPPDHPFGGFEEFFERFIGPRGNEGEGRKASSLGSGFVIDPKGYIVTNNHVIEGADEITVTFGDNEEYEAELIGRDGKTDLALLKIEAGKELPYVTFGNSDQSRVGDWIIVIGNPFGLGGTVTTGIISAKTRDINAGPFDDFIQTDAAINRGNSGGPMFNLQGEVIGINTAIYSPAGVGNIGIGFAVPSVMAQPLIEQLKENGTIERGWLGVKIQTVTEDIADGLGLDEAIGALVAEVVEGSPADKAGIEVGDVIIRFDGQEIAEMKKLPRVVAEARVGKQVAVDVLRGGKERSLKVEVEKLDEEEEKEKWAENGNGPTVADDDKPVLGMVLGEITKQARKQYGFDKTIDGLLVRNSSGVAFDRGIRGGDVIVEANRAPVSSMGDMNKAIDEVEDAGRSSILLLIARGNETIFIALPIADD